MTRYRSHLNVLRLLSNSLCGRTVHFARKMSCLVNDINFRSKKHIGNLYPPTRISRFSVRDCGLQGGRLLRADGLRHCAYAAIDNETKLRHGSANDARARAHARMLLATRDGGKHRERASRRKAKRSASGRLMVVAGVGFALRRRRYGGGCGCGGGARFAF